jgi:hypothetical protein
MKVDRVTATLRYSAEARGAWRSLEIGAEATVAPDEDWHTAQASLYQQLAQQLQALWDNRRADEASEKSAKISEEANLPTTQEHYCQQHQVAYRRYEKDGKVLWAHKTPDDTWCRELGYADQTSSAQRSNITTSEGKQPNLFATPSATRGGYSLE